MRQTVKHWPSSQGNLKLVLTGIYRNISKHDHFPELTNGLDISGLLTWAGQSIKKMGEKTSCGPVKIKCGLKENGGHSGC